MLHSAIAAYVHCPLRRGARNTVFADGNPAAHVMILGEAPDVDEDRAAKPFQGAAGQMLDRMFAAIGIARDSADPASALYLASVLPWKPSGDRDPDPGEIAMMLPFVQRHIELVNPKVIIVMGNAPLFALTGQKGILRARGIWGTAFGIDLLPMTHPKYLLRTLTAKREAWADLLALQARLKGLPQIGSPSR
jgi:DNA polymerase